MLLSQKFRGYPLGFDGFVTYVTGSVPCAQFCYCFVVLILHTTKSWRGSYFLVVCDNDERTARRRSASELVFRRRTLQARSQGVNQKL